MQNRCRTGRLKAGMGLTLLPEIAVGAELAKNELVALPWRDGPLEITTLGFVRRELAATETHRA